MKYDIQNVELLTNVFGKFPSFHDAEVIQIILKSKKNDKLCPTLEALIRSYEMSSKQDEQGKNLYKHHYLVNLKFKYIFGLKLENFNHQNVLGSLIISEFSNEYWESIKQDSRLLGVVGKQEIERLNFHVKFEYCFGIEAEFLCSEVVVESVTPII
jgi:hypothetical protein